MVLGGDGALNDVDWKASLMSEKDKTATGRNDADPMTQKPIICRMKRKDQYDDIE